MRKILIFGILNLIVLFNLKANYTNIIITPVVWNNHPAAVTFTFDDAMYSQRTNIIPYLYKRGIRGTFLYLCFSYIHFCYFNMKISRLILK